jgi:hypothetical protein
MKSQYMLCMEGILVRVLANACLVGTARRGFHVFAYHEAGEKFIC